MPTGDKPTESKPKPLPLRTRPTAEGTMDIRDALSGLLGQGYTGMTDDKARGNYAFLAGLLGKPVAQKLMDKVFIFNQLNPHLSSRDRVSQFYDSSVDDPQLESIIKGAKTVGMGVLGGLNTSPDLLNMRSSGRASISGGMGMPTGMSSAKAIINKFIGQ